MPAIILPIITLSIYILLIPPTIFSLWKHGVPGLLGWGLLLLFALIRVATSALQMHPLVSSHGSKISAVALLLDNVGMSPLLLTTAGLLYEARTARDPSLPRRLEHIKIAAYHAAVMVSILLLIVGFSKVPEGPANGFMKIGMAGIMICVCILASWVFASYDLTGVDGNDMAAIAYEDGTRLLHATLTSLPLLTLRSVYALLTVFLPPSKFRASLAAQILMRTIPEILLMVLFVGVGIWTRGIKTRRRGRARMLTRLGEDIYPAVEEGVDRWGFKNQGVVEHVS